MTVYEILTHEYDLPLLKLLNRRMSELDCAPDGILQILVNMSPKMLTVYDLSGEEKNRLTEAILKVFGDRVKLYR